MPQLLLRSLGWGVLSGQLTIIWVGRLAAGAKFARRRRYRALITREIVWVPSIWQALRPARESGFPVKAFCDLLTAENEENLSEIAVMVVGVHYGHVKSAAFWKC